MARHSQTPDRRNIDHRSLRIVAKKSSQICGLRSLSFRNFIVSVTEIGKEEEDLEKTD